MESPNPINTQTTNTNKIYPIRTIPKLNKLFMYNALVNNRLLTSHIPK